MSKENIDGNEVTHYIIVKENHRYFAFQYVVTGAITVDRIFPISKSNAIGTLDEDSNGIVFIKFSDYGKNPENQVISQNFSSIVYGPFVYRFSPNFTDNIIIYSQRHEAIVADLRTGKAFFVGCGLSLDDYLLGICFLDPQNNLLAIVKSIKTGKPYRDSFLHVAKLDGQELIDTGWSIYLGETDDISPYPPLHNAWCVHDHKLFVYDHGQVLCTDGYQPVSHPFSETFNANSSRIGPVKDLAIHPKLPFGVIIEERVSGVYDLLVLRLDIPDPKRKGKQIISFGQTLEPLKKLFNMEHLILAYPSFSQDGNWYVVGCIDGNTPQYEPQSPYFVAIPVTLIDKKHPYFL